jgi:putative membrane protein
MSGTGPGSSGSSTGAASSGATASGIGGGATAVSGDDQILQVLHTANAGEIEQAKLAQQKSKNSQVKHFAAMMVKDHTDADHKGQDVGKKAHVTPSSSSVSTSLESDAKQMTSSMSSRTGAEFDRAYIDAQVKEHQSLLDLIDAQLAPNAKAPEVKSFVQAVRTKVQSHLKEAQDIQHKLASS